MGFRGSPLMVAPLDPPRQLPVTCAYCRRALPCDCRRLQTVDRTLPSWVSQAAGWLDSRDRSFCRGVLVLDGRGSICARPATWLASGVGVVEPVPLCDACSTAIHARFPKLHFTPTEE